LFENASLQRDSLPDVGLLCDPMYDHIQNRKTSSLSSLKGSSSSLGKPGFVVNSGSFGWIDEVGSVIGVL